MAGVGGIDVVRKMCPAEGYIMGYHAFVPFPGATTQRETTPSNESIHIPLHNFVSENVIV